VGDDFYPTTKMKPIGVSGGGFKKRSEFSATDLFQL